MSYDLAMAWRYASDGLWSGARWAFAGLLAGVFLAWLFVWRKR